MIPCKKYIEQWLLNPQILVGQESQERFFPVMDGDPIYGYSLWVKIGYSTVPIKMDG